MDDAAANISAGVFNYPSAGDTRAESARAEMLVQAGLGGGTGAVLVGRSFTTHEMNEAITSTYRVARATSASQRALRASCRWAIWMAMGWTTSSWRAMPRS